VAAALPATAGSRLAAIPMLRCNWKNPATAVERCLERISEAAAKLGDLPPVLVPCQSWKEIRALGNRLRHECDAVREDRLWDIVQVDLPLFVRCLRS
jgi:uncharacterized protein with HEPN domain